MPLHVQTILPAAQAAAFTICRPRQEGRREVVNQVRHGRARGRTARRVPGKRQPAARHAGSNWRPLSVSIAHTVVLVRILVSGACFCQRQWSAEVIGVLTLCATVMYPLLC
jgi:hypothetical protein